jgi:protein translocase SEC61 complex gamma subunit
VIILGLRSALTSAWRVLKLTRKSDREEFFLYMKLVFLGFAIVGAIGFLIYFIATELELNAGLQGAATTTSTGAILFHLLVASGI